ncbi:MAG: carboxypeptidase-like regulatory domain-containing protein [Bacteroidales bacterium]|nr:carboxypeptidase-like regulatory domain-containing protein [Bacteroidales bacterium]
MKKFILGFCFYLLVFSSISAQESYLTLRGRVTDRDTREGLPAVTVYVAGQAIYTQTNNDGEYVLKVPSEHRGGSVVYALMGYLRDTVSIAKAQHKGDIALTSDGGRWLKEVNVTEYSSKSAAKLLMDAVNRIPQNYQTDSVVGTWFYRDVRMLNDELFLFDEMVFDALRVGYDKHHALRKLYNKTGPYGSVKLDYKRPIESNYTAIRHDRLLLCDTAYVNRVTNGIAGDKINYDESEVLYDPVEVPNTVPRLTVSKLKKAKNLRMYETTDADGKEYYVITTGYDVAAKKMMKIRDTVRITIAKGSLTITRYEEWHYFMMYPYFPLKKVFKDAGVDSMANRSHVVYNYGMVEGKYTLTSYTRHEGSDLYCAKNSPLGERIQHLDKQCQCVLTNEHKEGASFLKNNTIQSPGSVLVMNRRADNKSYNEAFWQQYNFIPLENSIRQKLEKKLKKY